MEAGAEVDIARAAGLAMTEEKVLRNTLEKARMTASSPTSTVSVFSSASTTNSDDYSKFDSLSADSSLHGCLFGNSYTTCSSVREVEMADFADFEMGDAECLQGQGQLQMLFLPLSLSMLSLSGLLPLFEMVSWTALGM